MHSGDFRNLVNDRNQQLQVYDAATTRPGSAAGTFVRDHFPGNQIPQARFSAFSRQWMTFGQPVKPNRGGQPGTIDYLRNNYIATGGSVLDPQTKGSLKFDHAINSNHRLGFFANITKYFRELGPGGPPGLPLPLWDGQLQTFEKPTG